METMTALNHHLFDSGQSADNILRPLVMARGLIPDADHFNRRHGVPFPTGSACF
jgi:hypothetical protein